MKEKNKVFFGEHGLTSTSATHLANVAKERIANNEALLANMNFVTTKLDIVGSADEKGKVISKGYSSEQLGKVHALVEEIAQMNAFCAWMREAVKAREEELAYVADKPFARWWFDYCKKENLKAPNLKEVTEDDIIAEMDVKTRNEYFTLEAYAATIGKAIHPNGAFSEARRKLQEAVVSPYSTEGKGANTLIYSREPSVDTDDVEKEFFDMQSWHRDMERRLNQMKFEIKSKVNARNLKAHAEYDKAHNEVSKRKDAEQENFNQWKIKETERIGRLKIVVPNALQATYEKLENM